jgi:hypothetical protein
VGAGDAPVRRGEERRGINRRCVSSVVLITRNKTKEQNSTKRKGKQTKHSQHNTKQSRSIKDRKQNNSKAEAERKQNDSRTEAER